MDDFYYNRGVYYVAIGWTLTGIAWLVVLLRLYSRLFVTRSAGSDDFTIAISACLTLAGEIGDTLSFAHGLGRHKVLLTEAQFIQIERWTYIDWMVVLISYFFVRASVMLFVLRLLPPTKVIQRRIIYAAFSVNIAITIIATVTYGVRCIPFEANWQPIPDAKCFSEQLLVTTQYVNGILACITDVITALIPQFLLYKVRIRPRTKLSLNIIFGLGLITAGLSIGRVATANRGIWTEDQTWRELPNDTFAMVEEKCGIIFASLPAVRQFFSYYSRTGKVLPSSARQPPNYDFIKMRRRINLRDLFWYRKPSPREAQAVIDGKTPVERMPDNKRTASGGIDYGLAPAMPELDKSPLDIWQQRVKGIFGKSGSHSGERSDALAISSGTQMSTASMPTRGRGGRRWFMIPSFAAFRNAPPKVNGIEESIDRSVARRMEENERGGGDNAMRIQNGTGKKQTHWSDVEGIEESPERRHFSSSDEDDSGVK